MSISNVSAPIECIQIYSCYCKVQLKQNIHQMAHASADFAGEKVSEHGSMKGLDPDSSELK